MFDPDSPEQTHHRQLLLALEIVSTMLAFVAEEDPEGVPEMPMARQLVARAIKREEDALDGIVH